MKKVFILAMLIFLVSIPTVILAQGYVGPGSYGGYTGNKMTVEQAATMRDDTYVVLSGYIVERYEKKLYVFKDETGTILVKIDHDLWYGFSVSDQDRVTIYGIMDKHRRGSKIVVKRIEKE